MNKKELIKIEEAGEEWTPPLNSLTIDLESWVHRTSIETINSKIRKKLDGGFIIKSIHLILELFKKNDIRTTFFVVGEIFEWYPSLINEIWKEGHEIAFHTHTHRKLQSKEDLVKELMSSKDFLDEFKPKGFRAPDAFIRDDYLKILKGHKFSYDSSTYGEFRHDLVVNGINEVSVSTFPLYGMNESLTFPRNLSLRLLTREIPFGSGYFIGLLGPLTSWFIEKLNGKGISTNLFIHPWQILNPPYPWDKVLLEFLRDPRILPYFINRRSTFEKLISSHEFTTLYQLMENRGDYEKG